MSPEKQEVINTNVELFRVGNKDEKINVSVIRFRKELNKLRMSRKSRKVSGCVNFV